MKYLAIFEEKLTTFYFYGVLL